MSYVPAPRRLASLVLSVGVFATLSACILDGSDTNPDASGCDDLDFCDDCTACAVDGADTTFSDAGHCAAENDACSGLDSPCAALEACIDSCDANFDGILSASELDCVCANDGEDCVEGTPPAGSCYEVHADGVAARKALEACIDDVCASSCVFH